MNLQLKLLFATNGIFVIAGALLGPLYAIFVESFSVSAFTISLTWVALLTTSLITYTVVFKATKDSQETNINLIIAGYYISALAWLMFALSSELYQVFAIQALLGVGLAIGGPSWGAMVANHLDKGKNVHEYAEWNIIKKTIEILAVLFGGAVISLFGFEIMFVVMALFGLTAALMLTIYSHKFDM